MFRFKQPSSGSLHICALLKFNSRLKYIVKDDSVVGLHVLSSPCFGCVSCTVQNVTRCFVCLSCAAQCTAHTQNKDWIEHAATQLKRP